MHDGIIIYNREDYFRNKFFVQSILAEAPSFNMNLKLILTDEMVLEINPNSLSYHVEKGKIEKPAFVINRSRDCIIGKHFELMGCRVFNSSLVTDICNNKAKTHQLINSKGICSVKTLLCNKKHLKVRNINLPYPLILKSADGHGGKEVFLINNENELNSRLDMLNHNDFILQEICSNPGIDIRVFVMGDEIVAAVKRFSTENSFKANISVGGQSEKYFLNSLERETVYKIIDSINFDFVGIDFVLDQNNEILFNEIEDVVGTRTIYSNFEIDIVKKYLNYIEKVVSS